MYMSMVSTPMLCGSMIAASSHPVVFSAHWRIHHICVTVVSWPCTTQHEGEIYDKVRNSLLMTLKILFVVHKDSCRNPASRGKRQYPHFFFVSIKFHVECLFCYVFFLTVLLHTSEKIINSNFCALLSGSKISDICAYSHNFFVLAYSWSENFLDFLSCFLHLFQRFLLHTFLNFAFVSLNKRLFYLSFCRTFPCDLIDATVHF